jgi:RNA polymerase sigma factor (sigma-70 family)
MASDDPSALIRDHAYIVRQEARRFKLRLLDRDDLDQAGAMGLLIAAARFDSSLGAFPAYARLWVRKEMQRAVAGAEFATVVPSELVGRVVAIRALADGPGTNVDALAEALGLSSNTVRGLLGVLIVSAPEHEVPPPPSLASVEGDALLNALGAALRHAVAELPTDLRDAIDAHYGLSDDHPKSVRAVGRALGISSSTVRARTTKAIHQLRRALRAERPDTRSASMPTTTGRRLGWPDLGFTVTVPVDWEVFPGEHKSSNEIVRVKRDAAELSLTLIIWKQPAHGASLGEFVEKVRRPLAAHGYADFRVEAVEVAGQNAMTLQAQTDDEWVTRQYFFGGETAVYVLGFGTPAIAADETDIGAIAETFALL